MPGPPIIIYKTKKDYSAFVPVGLSEDKTKISSFPDPGDVVRADGGKMRKPTELPNGYWLDNKGIGPDSAFLSISYETYAEYDTVPEVAMLWDHMLDSDPFTEMYNCGLRDDDAVLEEIYSLVTEGRLEKCKRLK